MSSAENIAPNDLQARKLDLSNWNRDSASGVSDDPASEVGRGLGAAIIGVDQEFVDITALSMRHVTQPA